MATLPILQYPDRRLYKVAAPVAEVDDSIRTLVRDMAATMYAAPGVGLAATQVDVHKQVIVIDISPTHDQLKVFINPEILDHRGSADLEEGCLSVPGVYDRVARAEWIKVRALDAEGEIFQLETAGLLAVCIQHEMDHLKGKVFVDYLSTLKRNRLLARLRKQERRAG
jgi:peptide deformylase